MLGKTQHSNKTIKTAKLNKNVVQYFCLLKLVANHVKYYFWGHTQTYKSYGIIICDRDQEICMVTKVNSNLSIVVIHPHHHKTLCQISNAESRLRL